MKTWYIGEVVYLSDLKPGQLFRLLPGSIIKDKHGFEIDYPGSRRSFLVMSTDPHLVNTAEILYEDNEYGFRSLNLEIENSQQVMLLSNPSMPLMLFRNKLEKLSKYFISDQGIVTEQWSTVEVTIDIE
jgi:hypothetical protein